MVTSGDRDGIDAGVVTRRILALARETQAKILVVDDNDLELTLMCDRLQACGFEVRRAPDGVEALRLLEHEWFPVILTDWQMPIMSGVELTQRLRAKGVTDTFIIMLTVLDSRFDYEEAYRSGVDDYLTKKVPEVELFARIHAAFTTLNLRRSLQDARAALAARDTK
jgi:two-component system, cell cycle response regulator